MAVRKNLLNNILNFFRIQYKDRNRNTRNDMDIDTDTDTDTDTDIEETLEDNINNDDHNNDDDLNTVETYSVIEPYADIKIVYDPDTQINRYMVSEPLLSEGEKVLLKELKDYLYESITINIDPSTITIDGKETHLREIAEKFLRDHEIVIDPSRMEILMYYLIKDSLGYGKLDPVIRDWRIEDISADGPDIPVYVYHRRYHSIPTNIVFSKDEIDSMVLNLAQKSGKYISLASPLLDATLPGGSRLQASIGDEVTARGSSFTIRLFRTEPLTPINLLNYGTYSPEMIAYLWLAVENGKNIIIAGTTASGKTSTLNSIAMFIPPESKIVSIEDTRELNLHHENWVPSITREAEEAKRSIDMYALLKTALRQRPEYLIVGEVRGREAYALFQAMATGHITYSTIHANSADTVVQRLINPPLNVPLMMLGGIDIVCVQAIVNIEDRRARRCTEISEVSAVDIANDKIIYNQLFVYNPAKDDFSFSGESKVFKELMETLMITEEVLAEEFKKRIDILRWMKERNMESFEEFVDVIVSYHREPERIMARVVDRREEKEEEEEEEENE